MEKEYIVAKSSKLGMFINAFYLLFLFVVSIIDAVENGVFDYSVLILCVIFFYVIISLSLANNKFVLQDNIVIEKIRMMDLKIMYKDIIEIKTDVSSKFFSATTIFLVTKKRTYDINLGYENFGEAFKILVKKVTESNPNVKIVNIDTMYSNIVRGSVYSSLKRLVAYNILFLIISVFSLSLLYNSVVIYTVIIVAIVTFFFILGYSLLLKFKYPQKLTDDLSLFISKRKRVYEVFMIVQSVVIGISIIVSYIV